MAIQTSLRVRKTFANQFAVDTNMTAGSVSRLYMFFVSDAVPIPVDENDVTRYLYAVFNYSPNYGGGSGNRANLLAWTKVMGSGTANAGDGSALVQSGEVVRYLPNRTITPINTGDVGSVVVMGHNYSTSATPTLAGEYTARSNIVTGVISATPGNPGDITIGIPEAQGSAILQQNVMKNYFNGLHFISDSVGTTSSSAMVKMSTLSLTSGTPFTLNGFSVTCNMHI